MLWRVWQATGLGPRWSEASARGGPVGAAADRDLDAVLALFEAAAKHTDRLPGADVAGFTDYLADQQLPGDSLAARAPQGEAVALLTAHAARGREWDVVAVPAVQEGSWPDLRLRGSLLGNERLVDLVAGTATPGGRRCPRSAPLLAEERRLFYVACTRARHTLLVSAVAGEDEQPSRFLDELDPMPADQADRPVHRPGRSLVLAELVGELRRAVCEPDAADEPAAIRAARGGAPAAGRRPAGPAGRRRRARRPPRRLVRPGPAVHRRAAARPRRAGAGVAVGRGEDRPVPAALGAGAARRRRARARWPRSPVRWCTRWCRPARPARTAPSWRGRCARRGRSWTPGRPGSAAASSGRVRGMLAAFDGWVRSSRAEGLRLVAVEQPVRLDLPGTELERAGAEAAGGLQLRGRVDRLEVDADGRPVVVDVKTGKVALSGRAAAEHPQLAVYQLAAALGAFGRLLEPGAPPGGARLVYLADQKAGGQVKEPAQPPLDEAELARWEGVLRQCARESSGRDVRGPGRAATATAARSAARQLPADRAGPEPAAGAIGAAGCPDRMRPHR